MKNKLKIIIPIGIAVIAIALAFVFIRFAPTKASVDIGTMISTAQQYVTEQKYEHAVAEFQKIIDIDPKNVDAYIGLAKAYIGLGDTDKAVEVLEDGYDKTGDERILEMLEELKPAEETTVETIAETTTEITTDTTIETTVETASEKTEEEKKAELIKQKAYDEVIDRFIGYNFGEPGSTEYFYFDDYGYYTILKMEYGSSEFFNDKDTSRGNWIKETWVKGDYLTINERRFDENKYMDCLRYNTERKEKYISDGWGPATIFTFPSYICSDFVLDKIEENKYIYKHRLYDEFFDYGDGYKLYVYIDGNDIEKIDLEHKAPWYDENITFEFSETDNSWVANHSRWGNETYYPYKHGLPEGYDKEIFNITDSEFTEVSSWDEFYRYP